MALETKKQGCTGVYTWEKVKNDIQCLYDEKRSLRAVAEAIGEPITHGDIQRILRGIEPQGVLKRLRLGLPATKLAPVCQFCGDVHPADRCPHQPPARRYGSGATVVIRGHAHEVISHRRYMDNRPFSPVLVLVEGIDDGIYIE